MRGIVAKISALVNISVLARNSCVSYCAYILESVHMRQEHFFEASCSENNSFLHLLEELKLNELNLNEKEKKAVHEIIRNHEKTSS